MARALIVYETFFGNTAQVAEAMAAALQGSMEVTLCKADDTGPAELQGYDLVIVGSPTRAFRPSPATGKLLAAIRPDALRGVRVAAFDTRVSIEDASSGFLRFMIKCFGWAAAKIAKRLTACGGTLAAPPEGFCVSDSEGPLKEGELARAATWAGQIAEAL